MLGRAVLAALAVASVSAKGFDECDACFVVFESIAQVLRHEHDDRRVPSRFRLDTQESFGDAKSPRHAPQRLASGRRDVSYAASEERTSFLLDRVCGVATTYYPTKFRRSPEFCVASLETRAQEEQLLGPERDARRAAHRVISPVFFFFVWKIVTIPARYANGDADELPPVSTEEQSVALSAYCDGVISTHRAALAEQIAVDAIVEVSSSDASASGRKDVCKTILGSCSTDRLLEKAQQRWDAAVWYAADKKAKAEKAEKKKVEKIEEKKTKRRAKKTRKIKRGSWEPGGF